MSNSTNAHDANAITASETGWLQAGSIAAQLSQIVNYLGAQNPERGSNLIGSFLIEGDRLSLPAGTLRSQIQHLIAEIEGLDSRYGAPQFADRAEYQSLETKTFPGVYPTRIDLKWTDDINTEDKTWHYNWHNNITITLVPIANQQVLHIKNERPDPIIIDIGVI